MIRPHQTCYFSWQLTPFERSLGMYDKIKFGRGVALEVEM